MTNFVHIIMKLVQFFQQLKCTTLIVAFCFKPVIGSFT